MFEVQKCKFVSKLVKQTLRGFIKKAFPEIKTESILLQNGLKGQYEYVSPSAMKYFNMNKNKKQGTSFGCKNVTDFAQKIVESFHENQIIGSIKSNQKGFLQIKVKDSFIQARINELMKDLSFEKIDRQNVLVDFSSPNIAKQMHVGHLRSTIIGESLCRMLEFMGHKVIRANHIGDWGTQFGMLIAFMQLNFPNFQVQKPQIKDLDEYYKAARKKFDQDSDFKKLSQETVVKLQAHDQSCINAWKMICQVSREYFNAIYKRLQITLDQYGESYYNKFIPEMLKELEQKNLIKQDDTVTKKGVKKNNQKNKQKQQKDEQQKQTQLKKQQNKQVGQIHRKKAKCIFVENYPIPLIVVKSDGGYNYDTTDLAALKYRCQDLKMNRIIIVTDSGQRQHFQMIFSTGRKVKWVNNQRLEHMGFGVVLGQDGKKFKTRNGFAVKLLNLLNEAKEKALEQLKSRQKGQNIEEDKQQIYTALKPEEYEQAAEKLGLAAIKYYDLKQNRISDYIFDFKKMLDPKGNTAVYLIYAYVRMCSIIRKSGFSGAQIEKLCQQKPFRLTHNDERTLAAMLIKFYDQLQLNKMTDFIYEIAVKVQQNYKKYRILGDQHTHSRIILCQCLRRILFQAFFMVGIEPIEKI